MTFPFVSFERLAFTLIVNYIFDTPKAQIGYVVYNICMTGLWTPAYKSHESRRGPSWEEQGQREWRERKRC